MRVGSAWSRRVIRWVSRSNACTAPLAEGYRRNGPSSVRTVGFPSERNASWRGSTNANVISDGIILVVYSVCLVTIHHRTSRQAEPAPRAQDAVVAPESRLSSLVSGPAHILRASHQGIVNSYVNTNSQLARR